MKHRVKILTFLLFGIVMVTLACSRAASPVPVTPSPELPPRQKFEKALTIIQEQKNKFLQKQQTLGEQIKSTHQSMQPAERDIKLKQYGAYLQAVGDLESLEARLELAITKLDAQEAIGETQNLAEQTKAIETELKVTLDIDPLDNSANATVDTEALLAGLLAQTATITSNETNLPTQTPEVATPTGTYEPTSTPTTTPTPTVTPTPTPTSPPEPKIQGADKVISLALATIEFAPLPEATPLAPIITLADMSEEYALEEVNIQAPAAVGPVMPVINGADTVINIQLNEE